MSRRSRNIQAKKRHFQLLEIMIAMFLLLICVSPMLHIYTHLFKEQQALIRSYQQDHLAHLIHAKITEQLYKRQIPLEDLLEGKSNVVFEDAELKKTLDPLGHGCTYMFTMLQPSKKQKKSVHYLLRLDITMKDFLKKPAEQTVQEREEKNGESSYGYMIYIDSGARAKKNSSLQQAQTLSNTTSPEKGAVIQQEGEITQAEEEEGVDADLLDRNE